MSSLDHECAKDNEPMSGGEEMETYQEIKLFQKNNSFVNPFEKDHDLLFEFDSDLESEEEKDKEIDHDQPDDELGPDFTHVQTETDVNVLLEDTPFLVFLQQLKQLANTSVNKMCPVKGCQQFLSIKTEVISSALYLKWICTRNHLAHSWCSQPILNRRLHSGDLLFSSALLQSGSNYQKINLFAKFLKLPIPSSVSYLKMQRSYLIPTIDEIWKKEQNELFEHFHNQDLVVLGNGRMDSPGHSAQYCSYTFMEMISKKILCIITMDKRMTERKSTNLEKDCFKIGLQFLLDKGMKIIEVVTDAHIQVEALMKREYPNIKHSFDIWHGAKNLGKKVIKAGQEKGNKSLLDWTRDVVNHYWYSAEISKTTDEFLGVWCGIIHHVVNEHEWAVSYTDTGSNTCQHGPLCDDRQKGWLKAGSPTHNSLIEIVMNKRLISKIPYYLNCRSTSGLENFQNLILKYASKRHSYNPPSYRARNFLAALDHNANCQRNTFLNKDGSTRYQRYYSKKGGRWSTYALREDKNYEYIESITKDIVMARIHDPVGMNGRVVLSNDDPRRISPTLAPTPPPPTSELVAEKKSRFVKTEDPDKTLDYDWSPC